MDEKSKKKYLECESQIVYLLLIASCGLMGAYTNVLKGGVFCNAQTGNILLMGIAIGSQNWHRVLYLFIPISAYFLGAFVSEILPVHVRKMGIMRWDTLLVGIEVIALIVIGVLPDSVPVQVTQVLLNFICSMQYNTFRQAQGIPMATTFCTNHLRQAGVHIAKWVRKKDKDALARGGKHFEMILSFIIGAAVGTILCNTVGNYAIWGSAFIHLIVFIDLLFSDLVKEKGKLNQVPSGH
jgi:uncharacterized membrane protein YoaK (UPF0700 family)